MSLCGGLQKRCKCLFGCFIFALQLHEPGGLLGNRRMAESLERLVELRTTHGHGNPGFFQGLVRRGRLVVLGVSGGGL